MSKVYLASVLDVNQACQAQLQNSQAKPQNAEPCLMIAQPSQSNEQHSNTSHRTTRHAKHYYTL